MQVPYGEGVAYGGHMPDLDDESRAAMHEDARKLMTGEVAVGQR